MSAAQIPAGVTRLPHLLPPMPASGVAGDAMNDSDYILAVMRHIAGAAAGGIGAPPSWKYYGVRDPRRARQLEEAAPLYVAAVQGR